MGHVVIAAAISIHALCEEGDLPKTYTEYMNMIFLSTPSARRATLRQAIAVQHILISIHALCEEGDALGGNLMESTGDFYPRPLRGGRPEAVQGENQRKIFLSTPSARRATCVLTSGGRCWQNFYPRPLRGGRQQRSNARRHQTVFLSTPSARRATLHGHLLF